jgi:hypothetical protein
MVISLAAACRSGQARHPQIIPLPESHSGAARQFFDDGVSENFLHHDIRIAHLAPWRFAAARTKPTLIELPALRIAIGNRFAYATSDAISAIITESSDGELATLRLQRDRFQLWLFAE